MKYQFINSKVLSHGIAVLSRYEGQYHIDIYLSDGKSPIYSKAFDYVSVAKAWRENNANSYTKQ